MKIRNMITAGAMTLMMLMWVGVMAADVMADVQCPTGTIHANKTKDSLAECNIESDDSLWPTMQTIINVVLGIVAVIAVIMIIIGGIEYTVSRGDATKTKKGRDTIIYSVIGLVIALLSFAIVNFVLSEVFNGGESAMPKTNTDKKATSYVLDLGELKQIS